MANAELLEKKRKESGKSKTFLAIKLNVSRPCLYSLMKNPERCTFSQAEVLSKELDINSVDDKNEIFLP